MVRIWVWIGCVGSDLCSEVWCGSDPCAVCVCMARIWGCLGVMLLEISLCVHSVHHFLEFFCGLILENVERM